jgi:hypothetical protein
MIRGTCLCSAIGWAAEGPFELMAHCHCSMCRKAHGASFATAVGAPLGIPRRARERRGSRVMPVHARRVRGGAAVRTDDELPLLEL